MSSESSANPFAYLVAIVLPPLALAGKPGIDSATVLLNVLLTLLGWIPGVLHAWTVLSQPTSPTSTTHVTKRARSSSESTTGHRSAKDRSYRPPSESRHHSSHKRQSSRSGRRESASRVYIPVDKSGNTQVNRRT